jgi:hypothetical protein
MSWRWRVIWNVAIYCLVDAYKHFGRTCCLCLDGLSLPAWRWWQQVLARLCCSSTERNCVMLLRCCGQEGRGLHIHRHENDLDVSCAACFWDTRGCCRLHHLLLFFCGTLISNNSSSFTFFFCCGVEYNSREHIFGTFGCKSSTILRLQPSQYRQCL